MHGFMNVTMYRPINFFYSETTVDREVIFMSSMDNSESGSIHFTPVL